MNRKLVRMTIALLLVLASPVAAQQNDGIDNDNDGQTDEPDEYDGAGLQPGGLEAECAATARPEICLAYFQLNCRSYGFPMACAMANLGSQCSGGDPGQCQYFLGILQANTACAFGDQNACAYLAQQPLLRQ